MNFFKTLLASLLGAFLAMALVLVVFIAIIVSALSSSSDSKVIVKQNSVLNVTLDQVFVDRTGKNDFNLSLPSFSSKKKKQGLNDFIKNIERAKKDDNIKGIFLETAGMSAAPSTLLDVRNTLMDFKKSGKWIVAYSEGYSQADYFVASAADEIYLYPEGELDWRGLNAEVVFYKNLFDKLGIEAQVVRGPNNRFKSAVEPYIYDKMSPENKAQVETFIGDIWKVILENVSASRSISVEQLNLYADSLALFNPQAVVEAKMVDGLKYRDEITALLKEKVGLDSEASDKDLSLISFAQYKSSKPGSSDEVPDIKKDRVAVVYAVGGIESGEGDDETIGSDRIAEALKKAREDEKVKAIVFRVNSPGGSALASDVIWRETQLIKKSGKPFYVSMGDYAASGGYYISCDADKIYANENTITGSIGVFGIIPNLQKFWNEKVGITFDNFETNPHADLTSTNKPLDEMEMTALENMVADIYDSFTSKVASGRGMTQEQVDAIGQGRVWSGEDAKEIGLVDEIGDLQDCIKAIAEKAGLTDYAVKELPVMIDPFQKWIESMTGDKQEIAMAKVLGENYKMYRDIKSFSNMKGVQARIPFLIEIK